MYYLMLPQIILGKYQVSRLIVGANPISGFSHQSPQVDKEMIDYHTTDNIKKLLKECEENGINTFQARGDRHIVRVLNEYWNEGGKIQWIAQNASELSDLKTNVEQIKNAGAIAIYNHGTQVDNLWNKEEKGINQVKENLKIMRDSGLVVGLGSHRPLVIQYACDQQWDVDFFMTSWYNLAKGEKHVQATQGFKEEVFDDNDSQVMINQIQSTSKPCLVFKILGAGRKTSSPQDLESAFRYTFDSIKPSDAVIVGMYQKNFNQVQENADLVKRILSG